MSETASPPSEGSHEGLEPGVGLCLSGGGYRAMLFHVGALWRLNEAGWLPRLTRVSSVSGGSITAGVLALSWPRLAFDAAGRSDRFGDEVVAPLRGMAARTIDVPAIVRGVLLPGTVADRLAAAYRKHLFGTATLQDLPDDPPRFVFDATNLQSAALWRFSKPYMRDYRVGEVKAPTVDVATAVAASSGFPPFLSPVVLTLRDEDYTPGSGTLQQSPYTTRVMLTDGGVYDNLGLETVWGRCQTVLISDGGGHIGDQPKPSRLWPLHAYRVLGVIDNQVRSLRKRWAVEEFIAGRTQGTYWGLRTDIADYELPSAIACAHDVSMRLAAVPTRLAKMPDDVQERLINWGYAVSDAGLRRHVDSTIDPPAGLPYPDAGFG
jgi:NTE family protein